MHRTLVLNVVGLTPELLARGHTPRLSGLASDGALRPLATITPAVTCSVQATLTTGLLPRDHGIVGNGWYFRELSEIWLWRQSNKLVGGEKIWDAAKQRDPSFRCAKLFWWYNMYSSADVTITPRPMYLADGRKLPDVYSEPPALRDQLQQQLGQFPLFQFWGPSTTIASTQWIADAARHVWDADQPTLSLVYLPHLDYGLQQLGPRHPGIDAHLREVDAVAGQLIDQARAGGARVIVCSEYGITDVSGPIHVNRALREAGLLRVRAEQGLELLDPGASAAFAVSDHQIAHVYVKDRERVPEVARLLSALPGVERVLDEAGKRELGLDHARSGELVLLSAEDRWFSYYYWLDDARAPDFARTVDIHKKPGYDPVELFLDPAIALPKVRVGLRLLKRALGFRALMDVIPLDASLVRGSHGRVTESAERGPLVITSERALAPEAALPAHAFKAWVLAHVFGG
jgi:predicted AlkP superfamily pyrophosphatase or phosphodiesterase